LYKIININIIVLRSSF